MASRMLQEFVKSCLQHESTVIPFPHKNMKLHKAKPVFPSNWMQSENLVFLHMTLSGVFYIGPAENNISLCKITAPTSGRLGSAVPNTMTYPHICIARGRWAVWCRGEIFLIQPVYLLPWEKIKPTNLLWRHSWTVLWCPLLNTTTYKLCVCVCVCN